MACIGLFFSCIFIIKAFNESKIYDNPWDNAKKALGAKIISMENTLKADLALKEGQYEKALLLISWNTSEDYYNRWTLQTILVYKNALQSNLSWLENAQILVAQAQKNLDIAKRLATAQRIKNAITDNQSTLNSLSTVVDIKNCYGRGDAVVRWINTTNNIIKGIKSTLDEEQWYISKRSASLDPSCYEKLNYILDTSREQVGLLDLQMQKNSIKYKSDLSDRIDEPAICIQSPYENILPSIRKGEAGLQEYEQQHQNTIEALKKNDSQSIKDVCDQSKNDAQINQKIESSVQELLQKLEENKIENQEKKRSSNQANYKDFFNEDEKNALLQIKKINQWRIENTLEIRGKWNYSPEKYINNMFNQFYGNSGDFINLHK